MQLDGRRRRCTLYKRSVTLRYVIIIIIIIVFAYILYYIYYIGTRTTQYYTYIVLVPHAPIYKRCKRRAGTVVAKRANSLGIPATDNYYYYYYYVVHRDIIYYIKIITIIDGRNGIKETLRTLSSGRIITIGYKILLLMHY